MNGSATEDAHPRGSSSLLMNWESTLELLEAYRTNQQKTQPSLCLDECKCKHSDHVLSKSLGDFRKLFSHCNWNDNDSTPKITHSTDTELEDTLPSSLVLDTLQPNKGKNGRWTDEVLLKPVSGAGSHRSRELRRHRATKCQKTTGQDDYVKIIKNTADFESEVEDYLQPALSKTTKVWATPSIPNTPIDPHIIQLLETLTYEEKMAKLSNKLYQVPLFKSSAATPIHIFVDLSNIVIGFFNAIKIARGLNEKAYIKQPPFAWDALSLILERGRHVARRIVVGSSFMSGAATLPSYISRAEELGYDVSILERVVKRKGFVRGTAKKRNGSGNGYATTSGHSSSDRGHITTQVCEQGVDEILQMKLLESLVDTQLPTTIILASGDSAEAEYSGGFFKNVERALLRGWNVELFSWAAALGREYRSKEFLERWRDHFHVVELDQFTEELLALWTYRFGRDT
ncbi:hypothetical protein BJ878DRAFT_498187 [Calycina marina]|uniref:NYN domain-containing protein n=1 Tax=Calycina marina TaxID=1763456 RepID=A0A9P7Z5W4_9HELO|nr:hypothetical protein BJ878DRAFT_498187 [Calycina marina]